MSRSRRRRRRRRGRRRFGHLVLDDLGAGAFVAEPAEERRLAAALGRRLRQAADVEALGRRPAAADAADAAAAASAAAATAAAARRRAAHHLPETIPFVNVNFDLLAIQTCIE